MSDFVHLHVHSVYSLLDGESKISDLVERAKELGMSALALTDHGTMAGAFDFYQQCKAAGIRPIIGCEVYVAPDDMHNTDFKESGDERYHHLILLAENETGFHNLCRIQTIGQLEGFYYKPRVDTSVLRKYADGIICLSACIAGSIPRALLAEDHDLAKSRALELQEIFGKDSFFIEIQDHGIKEEQVVLPKLISLAEEIGAEVVATNDCHYTRKEDAEVHDVLLCIQTGAQLADEKRMRFEGTEFYVKSEEEMRELFKDVPESITNTRRIAERCAFDYTLGIVHAPVYDTPNGYDSNLAYLKSLCEEGMRERYGREYDSSLSERLSYELDVIDRMGFVDYFLTVWDYINFAKKNGIVVGPGRGSGAGSIVAYAIGITNLDPIRFNLLFERFLNPERVSMPDFDIDFEDDRRQEVVDYVTKKYGRDRVCKIVTYQVLHCKSSVRDVGRVLGYPYADVDVIAKMIPSDAKTLKEAMKKSQDLKERYEQDEAAKRMIDLAMKLEGIPKAASQHAAGVLIADQPIADHYAPLMRSKDEKDPVIENTMSELEELGLLKFDFLGLKTLTVIKNTVNAIRATKDPSFDIDKIDPSDKNVYAMLSSRKTLGVFQLESPGMTDVVVDLKPQSLEDLTAIISLYRPGPMDFIPEYVSNKHNSNKITYPDERLRKILSPTYGVIVYQEQVMQIFQELAGFSLGRADIVRRAMSKKKLKVMEEEKKNFIYGLRDKQGNLIPDEKTGQYIEGALSKGVSLEVCEELMERMTAFANYAFNKAHAASYAVVAYQTAYLACYHPVEFYAAFLTSYIGNNKKMKYYINLIPKQTGIRLMPPDINKSDIGFKAEDGAIRFGLAGIKGVGESVMKECMEKRLAGDYTDFSDFISRMKGARINKKGFEALICAGAFDFTGYSRNALLSGLDQLRDEAKKAGDVDVNQLSLFSDEETKTRNSTIPDLPEWDEDEKLKREHDALQVYLSGHPLQKYDEIIRALKLMAFDRVIDTITDKEMKLEKRNLIAPIIFGEVSDIKTNRKGGTYRNCSCEGVYTAVSAYAGEKTLKEYGDQIVSGSCAIVELSVSTKEEEVIRIRETMDEDGNVELTEVTEMKTTVSAFLNKVFPFPEDTSALGDYEKLLFPKGRTGKTKDKRGKS